MAIKSKKTVKATTSKKEVDDELLKMCKGLSNDMSKKTEELARQHEDMSLTLTWFLIATSAIIITASDVTWWAKWCLGLSIVCLVLWWFYNWNLIWAQSIKVYKSLQNVFPIPSLKTDKEKLEALEKIENWIKANKNDIIFSTIVSVLHNLWIIFFIIWLFIYL